MKINKRLGNILEVPQGYYIAHCISGDFSLGAGLAKAINENYNMAEKLNFFYIHSFNCWKALLVDNVFNLVVKNEIAEKASYDSLKTTLYDMEKQMKYLKINKLAIPKLGCGKEGLVWTQVEKIIKEVFDTYSDLEILVVER